jgi:hypothetical protein
MNAANDRTTFDKQLEAVVSVLECMATNVPWLTVRFILNPFN